MPTACKRRKRRGITIDLGFAHLELPEPNGEKLRLGFVDVSRARAFVRNMLAGVGGMDVVLFIVAADEGVMPQTREHFDICRLLGIGRGITVITKSGPGGLQVPLRDSGRESFRKAGYALIARCTWHPPGPIL